jgi:hypothetical protein
LTTANPKTLLTVTVLAEAHRIINTFRQLKLTEVQPAQWTARLNTQPIHAEEIKNKRLRVVGG